MSEVNQWSTTQAGNEITRDDIDLRPNFERTKVRTNMAAIMAAVRRAISGSSSLTPTATSADTTNINAAITAGATQSTILLGAGTFTTTGGHSVPGTKLLNFTGAGLSTVVQRASGTSFLLTYVSDDNFVPGFRKLEGITFDGNGPDEFNPATGSQGVKIGGGGASSASIVHPVVRDCYFRRFGLGAWHYSSQQSLVETTLFYRNSTGALYQTDDEHGGSTALTERKTVYQFNDVGMVVDKKAAFAIATTATMSNSSTALTSVASVTGITTGMTVTGPGIRTGTTVAAVSAGSITLSQTTTSTAAGSLVPILVRNTVSAVGSYPLYETDGPVFEGTLFQGNFVNGLALYSQDRVHLRDCYFERNCSGGASTATVLNSARVVPKVPLYCFNSTVKVTGGVFSEPLPSVTIRAEAGSVIRMEDVTCGSTPDFITGDLTSNIEFYGTLRDASGRISVPVGRWPDNIFLAKGISAIGNPFQVRGLAVTNAFTGNARLPAFNIDAGAITATTEQEAARGPVRAWAFPTVTGAIGVNSISTSLASGTVTNGDQVLVSLLIRADTYTNITASVTNGNYAQASLPVTPVWRRMVVCFKAESTNSSVGFYLFPTAADGPKIYVCNMMQVVVPAGGDLSAISTVLREGLFNDGTLDGALRGTATIDLGSIASGANGSAQTITVSGAAIGMRAVVTASIDTQGITLGARVSAANTVTFIPSNPTAGAIDLASATYTAFVTP